MREFSCLKEGPAGEILRCSPEHWKTDRVYPFFIGTSKNIHARTMSPLFISLRLLLIINIVTTLVAIFLAITYLIQ